MRVQRYVDVHGQPGTGNFLFPHLVPCTCRHALAHIGVFLDRVQDGNVCAKCTTPKEEWRVVETGPDGEGKFDGEDGDDDDYDDDD